MCVNWLAPPSPPGPACRRIPSNADTIVAEGSSTYLTPDASTVAPSIIEESPEEALRPDPGTENDFKVENNPFAFSPGQLGKLLNPKSVSAFRALGGLRGIARGLQSDLNSGLSVDETCTATSISFGEATNPSEKSARQQPLSNSTRNNTSIPYADRVRVFKPNLLPPKKPKPIWQLMWIAFNEKVLILLAVAGVISLALGLYETLGQEHDPNGPPSVDWVEGVAICVAVIIVVLVGSHNDWQKEKAFVKLNTKKDDREVKVLRSGRSTMINVHDLVVGDVLFLEPGDVVPVDGVLIEGHNLKCDESSVTGESDAIRKTAGDQVFHFLESKQGTSKDLDPFIISGSKILEGMGTYLCTAVGVHSSFGRVMMSVRTDIEATPLQKKLEQLAVAIAWLGGGASALMFFILLFRFVAKLPEDARPPAEKASTFVDLLVVAIAIVAVAVPEGLPLAVTLALAFATTQLLKENNLVRVLKACETMGNATTICSDKTGTLTTNKMTVVAGTFGNSSFSEVNDSSLKRSSISKWATDFGDRIKELLVQAVTLNSTAFECEENGQPSMVGSKTEIALLQLVKDHFGVQSVAEVRSNSKTVHVIPFDSSKKYMATAIELQHPGRGVRLLIKGASEILLERCSFQLDSEPIDFDGVKSVIEKYAKRSLRTISLVYKDFSQWPPPEMDAASVQQGDFDSVLTGLTLIGVVGIQDPVRPGVPEAVKKATAAGVTVRMVTGDNLVTAQAIASECGILTEGGIIMEGPTFRRLSDSDMNKALPKLQVLARSSPEDKMILVNRLKALGETVAVTGDGTNDAPALKAADVGFSMGISGTEVAKEASLIILMDDNFTSIVTALKWGRAVNDAVQKFLQFQITVNITAVILSFITAMYSSEMKPVLKAVQLLWLNLIMDTFAALALATDPPTDKILDRPPQGKDAPLITVTMWKMIIGQSIFQLIVTIVLYFAGAEILGYDRNSSDEMLQLDTIIFNTFVWMQIFNEFNNRRLDNRFNILEGVQRNKFFIFINLLMVALQITIIFIGSSVFEIKAGGLTGVQWAICIMTAFVSIPWGVLVRIFPDIWFAKICDVVGRPFVIVYRLLGKAQSKLFRKKDSQESQAEDTRRSQVAVPVILEPSKHEN